MELKNPAEVAANILRAAGIEPAEAQRAKRNIDARLDGLGLPPSAGLPVKIGPGRERILPVARERIARIIERVNPASEQGAATGVLLDEEGITPPHVEGSGGSLNDSSHFEPSDVSAAQAVTGLATTANGGTEVKFNLHGMVAVGSGAIGVYYARALGANINTGWLSVSPGLVLEYHPGMGLFFGTNTTGSIAIGGVLNLGFYRMPPLPSDPKQRRKTIAVFRGMLSDRLRGFGSDTSAGALASALGGGTDVTLGTFSDAGAGTQIFKAATNMPVGGASVKCDVIVNTPPANTAPVWVAETAALAVASNNGIGPSGQDDWKIPLSGKLFFLADSGTQKVGGRVRS